jgi:hypothetical protein
VNVFIKNVEYVSDFNGITRDLNCKVYLDDAGKD